MSGDVTREQMAMIMSAVGLINSELPVIKQKIDQNEKAIQEECRNREKEDNEIRDNYLDRFDQAEKQRDKISGKIDKLSGQLWGFIITEIGLVITAAGAIIITVLTGGLIK